MYCSKGLLIGLAALLYGAGWLTHWYVSRRKHLTLLPLGLETGAWKVITGEPSPYKIVCPFSETEEEEERGQSYVEIRGRVYVAKATADAYIVAVCANFSHHINNAAQIIANRTYLDSATCEESLDNVAIRLAWLTRTFVPQVLDGNVAVGMKDHEEVTHGKTR